VGDDNFSFFIGVSSITSSYFRIHKKVLPLVLLTAGFLIIILGHLFITGWPEGIIVPIGGFTIAGAHFINYKNTGACKTCHHVSNINR
jgi:hypothetical protein